MRRGFTLVEIMIVVAIIALLAAIAIPNLLGARRSANEAAARANVKTLATELETYAASTGNGAYYASLDDFKNASTAANSYCGQSKGGYNYTCTVSAGSYTITAAPLSNQTGTLTFNCTTGGACTP